MLVIFETRTTLPFGQGELFDHAATIYTDHEEDHDIRDCLNNFILDSNLYKEGEIPVYVCDGSDCYIYEDIAKIAKKFKCSAIFLLDDLDPEIFDTLYLDQIHDQEGIITSALTVRYTITDPVGHIFPRKDRLRWFVADTKNLKILFVEATDIRYDE